MTTTEENKEIVRRYYEEAFEEGQTELLEELVADDVVNHNPLSDETLTTEEAEGFEGFRHHVMAAKEGFPDATIRIDDLLAEDDKVMIRFTFEGTHEGRFGGIEPTGNRVSQSNLGLFRISDGKIAERWVESDTMEMLQQLGVLPADPSEIAQRPRGE